MFVFISVYVYMLKLQNSRTVSGIDKVRMQLWHFAMQESDQVSVDDQTST